MSSYKFRILNIDSNFKLKFNFINIVYTESLCQFYKKENIFILIPNLYFHDKNLMLKKQIQAHIP